MPKYTLQMRAILGGLDWQCEFETANDEIARKYAKRWCNPRNLPESCSIVVLFSEEKPIAEYRARSQVEERLL